MPKRSEKVIEILAPGKNLKYSKEAIKCGADAIYIGASKFSLRASVGNSLEDIKELIDYAHKYWVNVYIPFNCLIHSDEEIKNAKEMINEIYKLGADALIISDVGILEFDLPPIPIFFSTNTRCFKKEDVDFFEKCGVTRIILPRELSYNEIKDITDNTNVQIETFCYCFLCAGYSGNCYLSYTENLKRTNSDEKARNMASNFGTCASRCMGNWTLKDANGNIIRENDKLLQMKFLNYADNIGDLLEIGVDSFKIAGREKDLKHVKNLTAMFSNIANDICKTHNAKRISSGHTILGFKPDFSKNFNKGFTDFFYRERKQEMFSKYTTVGEKIGEITESTNNYFKIETKIELNIGDRFRYKIGEEQVKTIEIIDIKDDKYIINETSDNLTGITLYRYINAEGFKEVEESINYRVISVKLSIIEEDNNYIIYANDENNNSIRITYNKNGNIYKPDELQKQLYEIKEDCEFIIDEVTADIDILINDIENLKSKIFTELRKERAKNRPRITGKIEKNNYPYYKKELTYLDNITNAYAKAFFKRHGVDKIEDGLETGLDLNGKKVFSARYCLRNELGLCSKKENNNEYPFPWTIEQIESGLKYRIEFDCKNCSMYFYVI